MIRLTDRPDMTLAAYRGRKSTTQRHSLFLRNGAYRQWRASNMLYSQLNLPHHQWYNGNQCDPLIITFFYQWTGPSLSSGDVSIPSFRDFWSVFSC